MQGERNIRQLHSSHIKGVFFSQMEYFSGSFLIILMSVWAAQMSDFQLNTELESTGRLNIDYAWLGQFVWAVVYKPFRAQSIGIYKVDEWVYGDVGWRWVIWFQSTPVWLTGITWRTAHMMMFAKVRLLGKSSMWVDWAVIVAFWNILGPNKRYVIRNWKLEKAC